MALMLISKKFWFWVSILFCFLSVLTDSLTLLVIGGLAVASWLLMSSPAAYRVYPMRALLFLWGSVALIFVLIKLAGG